MKRAKVLMGTLLVLAAGCQGQSTGDTPEPVVTLALTNGNVVNFYDFHTKALVTEEGLPPNRPILGTLHISSAAAHLTEVFSALLPYTNSPKAAVPEALRRLQDRLIAPTSKVGPSASLVEVEKGSLSSAAPALASSVPAFQGKKTISSGSGPDSPVGCNNGCCDQAWLQSLPQCNDTSCVNNLCNKGNDTWDWNFFNYQWTSINNNENDDFSGFVCSAVGTSTWVIYTGDGTGQGSFYVQESHYLNWYWSQGLFDEYVDTRVNSSSDPHLHAYCGWLQSS